MSCICSVSCYENFTLVGCKSVLTLYQTPKMEKNHIKISYYVLDIPHGDQRRLRARCYSVCRLDTPKSVSLNFRPREWSLSLIWFTSTHIALAYSILVYHTGSGPVSVNCLHDPWHDFSLGQYSLKGKPRCCLRNSKGQELFSWMGTNILVSSSITFGDSWSH